MLLSFKAEFSASFVTTLAQLIPYVEQANYDYMTALHLCKAAVVAGELS